MALGWSYLYFIQIEDSCAIVILIAEFINFKTFDEVPYKYGTFFILINDMLVFISFFMLML